MAGTKPGGHGIEELIKEVKKRGWDGQNEREDTIVGEKKKKKCKE
jgi:hypothetical protein